MNLLFTLLAHVLRSVVILLQPGDCKSIVAENLLLKQQLLVLNRSRKQTPILPPIHRLFFAFWCQLLKRSRIERAAIVVRPSTLLRIHATFVRRKYRDLFSSKPRRRPGPKGPSPQVIQAILEFKCYFNEMRVHAGIEGRTPDLQAELTDSKIASLDHYRWQSHCNGLFAMPEAA